MDFLPVTTFLTVQEQEQEQNMDMDFLPVTTFLTVQGEQERHMDFMVADMLTDAERAVRHRLRHYGAEQQQNEMMIRAI
jgi:hypothetical protein